MACMLELGSGKLDLVVCVCVCGVSLYTHTHTCLFQVEKGALCVFSLPFPLVVNLCCESVAQLVECLP